ncbi:MAG: hypothetical protein R2708_20110 [Vicinamibacterales bacterium]
MAELLKKESLDEPEIYAAAGIQRPAHPGPDGPPVHDAASAALP